MAATAVKKYSEKDLHDIQQAFDNLLGSLESKMDEEDRRLMQKAYEMAVDGHAHQRRKSGEPYVLHPIEVARICVEEIGLGPTAIVCALLHDVVEDTHYELDDIREVFSERIAIIVDGLTKLDGSTTYESPQAENFRKVIYTLVIDVRVVLIKMADRMHNMRTLGAMPRHKQLKIAAETSYIYAPLAHRLGLYNLRSEFQDLCLKITEPEVYDEIANKIHATEVERERFIKSFLSPLERDLKEMGIKYRCFGRVKSVASIYSKIKAKKVPFEEVYDVFAVRVVMDVKQKREKQACWMAYSIVTDIYKPIPERLKDWVTVPKSNGYESLHTTVIGPEGRFVEVQIRSERMDEIAERGFAAHWKYKGVSKHPDVYEKWLDQVRELMASPNSDALEFISDFKNNLYAEEIFAVTPAGDLINLPKGATALDFAFHIHTDVGYHAKAIKVNNKIVPMGFKLSTGDQVEVITDRRQKPNESWLKIVVTGKARSKIRSAMKEERRKVGEFGKEAMQRKLHHLKVANLEQAMDTIIRHHGYKSHAELYYAIALEKAQVNELLKPFEVKDQKLVELPKAEPEPTTEEVKRPRKKISSKTKILVNGEPADLYHYKLANCCNPVQGDDIFAFLTSGDGLKIHRTNCPNATNLLARYGYRVMKAEWVVNDDSTFVAELKITGIDAGVGVIQEIMDKVSNEMGLNIRSFNIKGGDEAYFEGKISLMVPNTDQLYLVTQALMELESVSDVVRLK